LARSFTLDLAFLYSENQSAASTAKYGPREAFVPGHEILFANVLTAVVRQVDGDTVYLDVPGSESATLQSKVLGLPLEVQYSADDKILLHPIVTDGLVFTTQGCSIPEHVIPPGTYEVIGLNETAATLKTQSPALRALFDELIRFDITIVSIEKAPLTPPPTVHGPSERPTGPQ
jgi:hypothetical protein